ncbi:MAG: hypothetical protein ACK4J1_08735 [Hylemonella sp.]
MNPKRRHALLTLLALPAGCAIQPLPPLRTQPAAPPDGPVLLRSPAIGQHWTYRKYNGFNSTLLATETDEVVALAPHVVVRRQSDNGLVAEEWQHPWGQVQRDLSWDHVQTYEQPLPLAPRRLEPGATYRLQTHYRIDGYSYRYWIDARARAVGWEYLELPAGRLRTLRIEAFIRLQHHDISRFETIRRDTLWLAPDIGRWAARDVQGEYLIPDDNGSYRGLEAHHRWELTAWR